MHEPNTNQISALPSGHRIDDRFQIEALIAHDERSQVYLAKRLSSGDHVALRVLGAEYCKEPSQIESFRRVTESLKELHHPSLPSVFGFEKGQGFWFFVADHAEGISLESLLRSTPPRMEQAVDIALCMLSGLHQLHTSGLVHGDLRSASVLTKKQADAASPMPAARLLDLSFAHLIDAQYTPEKDLERAAAILYEMIVGVPPSEEARSNLAAPTKNALSGSAIPPALSAVMMRALSADPRERYATAKDFEHALAQAMSQPMVITPRDSNHGGIDAETLATSDTELNLKEDARAAVAIAATAPPSISTAKTLPVDGPPLPLELLASQSQSDTLRSASSEVKAASKLQDTSPPAPKLQKSGPQALAKSAEKSEEKSVEKSGLERWFWLLALLVALICVLAGIWIGTK